MDPESIVRGFHPDKVQTAAPDWVAPTLKDEHHV